MRYIKNFLHNINDIVLAIIIVAIAVGVIYWRLQIILDYPKQLADQQAVYNEEVTEDAEADQGEAAEQPADAEQSEEEAAEPSDQASAEEAPAEQPEEETTDEQPEG